MNDKSASLNIPTIVQGHRYSMYQLTVAHVGLVYGSRVNTVDSKQRLYSSDDTVFIVQTMDTYMQNKTLVWMSKYAFVICSIFLFSEPGLVADIYWKHWGNVTNKTGACHNSRLMVTEYVHVGQWLKVNDNELRHGRSLIWTDSTHSNL